MSRAIVQQQLDKTPDDDLFEIIVMGNEVVFDVVEHDDRFMIKISVVKNGTEKLKSWLFEYGMFPIIDGYLRANQYYKMAYIKYCSKVYDDLIGVRETLVGDGRTPFEPC